MEQKDIEKLCFHTFKDTGGAQNVGYVKNKLKISKSIIITYISYFI